MLGLTPEFLELYKQAEEPVRQSFLLSLPCVAFSTLDLSSALAQFFEALHNSPCDYCKNVDEQCVAGPLQRDAFRIIGLHRMAILANDSGIMWRKGYVRLITSLKDKRIRAKVVMEIRYEYVRMWLLEEMEADTRKEILDEITKIQQEEGGYPTLDGDSWFGVATPEFNSVCGVCKKGYKDGDTMINKTCGRDTCHMGCARKEWGERRMDWRAKPCQLCGK